MFCVRGGGDILTSSVLKFSAAGRASMPEECLRARAALWQGCSACQAVLTAARDALELCPTKSTVGFAVPPRPKPRRHQLSVETVVPGMSCVTSMNLRCECIHSEYDRSASRERRHLKA